jgi:hypothetical protein
MPTFCVPTLSGLPGIPASDLDWFSAPPDPTLLRWFPDNPLWLGAFSLSQGNGANRDVLFRALKGVLGGTNYLLLQFVARTSMLDVNIDRVNVLLGVPGGNYLAFNARLNTASATVAGTQDTGTFIYTVKACSVAGGVVSEVNPGNTSNADIEGTGRMWVDVTSPTRNIGVRWAFQVAIPLGAAWGAPGFSNLTLPAAGAFKMWFELTTSIGGMAVPQQWPPTAPQTSNVLQLIPPGILETQMLDLSTAGAGCTDAVRLTSTNVGTRAVPGGAPRPNTHTIKLDFGKPYPPLSAPYDENHTPNVTNVENQNEFFATPTFPVGTTVPQRESTRATFSLANWGSQYSTPTPASWRPIPGGTDVNFQNANNDCRFAWPTAAEPNGPGSFVKTLVNNINRYLNAWAAALPFPAGSQNPHQCMLVELSSTDPNVVITTSSVYTNMNVVDASTFRRFAEISVVGAPPISAVPRDVFLYTQKFNMPQIVKRGEEPRPPANFNGDNFSFPDTAPGGPASNDVEDIAAVVPTYTIHGYIDTGRLLELADGAKVKILRPQTAFGYFVSHTGELHGWETRLYGAEKLEENLYIVRVPNHGSVHVETVIQARENENERPLPEDGRGLLQPEGCFGFIWRLFGWKK